MSAIIWKESYELGIGAIDDQHKKLIGILNELFEAQQVGAGKEVIHSTLEKLVEYTHYHFDGEEDMLRQNNYPMLDNHIKEHQAFREQINKFLHESKTGNLILSMKTIDFLKDWTINHILGTDKEYGVYLLKLELGE